jgi:uncharacterized membrane protein
MYMATTIWILKGAIALLFAFTGINKLLFSKTRLLDKGMNGLLNLDEEQIKVAGFLEVLGALGLILPDLLNIYPVLSAIAALCLSLTMIVAGWINHRLKLSIVANFVIFTVCILIAYWEFA